MKKPKIAFLLYSLGSGGAERVVTTLANGLHTEYSVYIITFVKKVPFYPIHQEVKIISCFNEIGASQNFIHALKSNYLLLKKINHILKANDIDLLIGFMTSANVLATVVAKLNNIPVIISERNNPDKQWIPGFWKLLRIMIYPFANYLVVQTSEIQHYFAKKIRKDRLHILPNPISPELTLNRNIKVIKQDIILNVGSLTDQKGQDILIKAFALTNIDDWRLVIVGEGPKREKLEILIKELGIEQDVTLLGRIKDVHHFYNTSKIFAFSSLYEGFPNALIEAMHFGLPCVSTNCPTGPSELITDGHNGYLVSVNDVDQFAEKLSELMQNKQQRAVFGEKAKNSVKALEAENVVKKWADLIESCL
jgi:glycosyltransferase involved in cell wall biosynthesis